MKRRIAKLCVFLLAGAIANVAVAWGFANWRPSCTYTVYPSLGTSAECFNLWQRYEAPNWTLDDLAEYTLTASRSSGVGTTKYTVWAATKRASGGTTVYIDDCRYGWPDRSMRCILGTQQNHYVWRWLIEKFGWIGDDVVFRFPLQLIWPGFAINTIFYGAILWLLFAAPGFVRRRIRASRGQCPACAYPVGQSPICTECGITVRVRSP